jgi:hypothetical protein
MTPWKTKSLAGCAVAVAMIWALAVVDPLTTVDAQATKHAEAPAADASISSGMNDSNNPSHELLLDLQQMHLTNCAASVQQAMTFLFEGEQARFIAQPLGQDGDRWPSVFVVESASPNDGHTHLSTLMIAPNCSGMYEQVVYWSQSCDIVKSTVFAKFTGDHVLLKDVRVSASGPALDVYLTPAGVGCISVKKELFR